MEGLADVASAVMLIAVLVLAARGVRRKIPLWNRFYVPTAVLAGLFALCLGPEVAGRLYPAGTYLSQGIFPARVMEVWEHLPGFSPLLFSRASSSEGQFHPAVTCGVRVVTGLCWLS